jgi:HdeA/HdeB family
MFAKTIGAIALWLTFGASSTSLAQEIDLTTLKCGDFINGSQEAATNIMFWLNGYFTYEEDPPVINISKMKNKEGQLKQYCADNQSLPILEASEIFMDKKYNK